MNAFVNCMAFETLDEAKSADKLNWVVPCAFSFQTMDRTDWIVKSSRLRSRLEKATTNAMEALVNQQHRRLKCILSTLGLPRYD